MNTSANRVTASTTEPQTTTNHTNTGSGKTKLSSLVSPPDSFLEDLLAAGRAKIAKARSQWQQEILNSCVSPGILAANFQWLEGDSARDFLLSEAALDDCKEGWQRKKLADTYDFATSGGWAVNGQDPSDNWARMEWGQFKPSQPRNREGEPVKYETPIKQPARAILLTPSVRDVISVCLTHSLAPVPTFKAIAQHQAGIGSSWLDSAIDELGELGVADWEAKYIDQPLTGFWAWVQATPRVPITLTEGAKKAGAQLAAGQPAIALVGVWMGQREKDSKGEKLHAPQLIEETAAFAQKGRRINITFDQDATPKTRLNVGMASIRLGRTLEGYGCVVHLPTWDNCQGQAKGADDLIALKGAQAYLDAVSAAVPLANFEDSYGAEHGLGALAGATRAGKEESKEQARRWAGQQRANFSHLYGIESDRALAVKFIPDLRLPAAGGILAVSSPTGSGKTTQLNNLKAQFLEIHPDGVLDVLGARNMLGIQTAANIGADHIHDFKSDEKGLEKAWINSRQSLALCLDSLKKRKDSVLAAAHQGRGVCLVGDEHDAVIQHLVTSKTLKGIREEIIEAYADLVRACLSNGGYYIALEHNLTQASIDYLRAIAPAAPVEVLVNKGLARPDKQIQFVQTANKKGKASDRLLAIGAQKKALELHKEGKRILFVCDSQRQLEKFHELLKLEGGDMRRIDGTTANEQREFMRNPAAELANESCHLGLTSTAESGVDLPQGYFDAVVLYGSHLAPRVLYQMMNRERSDIPVWAYVRQQALFSEQLSAADLDTKNIIKQWRSLAGYAGGCALDEVGKEQAARLLSNSYSDIPIAQIANHFAALYEVRSRLGQADLRGELAEICEQSGFTVSEGFACIGGKDDEEFFEKLEEALENLLNKATALHLSGDISSMSLEQAKKLKRSGMGDRAAHLLADKVLRADRYPGLPQDNFDFAKEQIIKKKGRELKQHELLWMAANPEIAQQLSREKWAEANRKVWVIAHELPQLSLKANLIATSGLDKLLLLKEHGNTTPEKVAVNDFLVERAELMRQLFGYKFSGKFSPNTNVNKFLKGLGLQVLEVKKVGCDGNRSRIYAHSSTAVAVEVWGALERKWAETQPVQNPCDIYALGKHKKATDAILESERTLLNRVRLAGGGDSSEGSEEQEIHPPAEQGSFLIADEPSPPPQALGI